jgi:hypothetical protein
MSTRIFHALAASLVALQAVPAALAGEQVIIEPGGLRPPVLVTEAQRQVDFVNRTGRLVHMEFLGHEPDEHHVVQVQDQIWAVFHLAGRHNYEVHFLDPAMKDLKGAVEIREHPSEVSDPLVCRGVMVTGGCLER